MKGSLVAWLIVGAFGGTEPWRCGEAQLKHLTTAGFEVIAVCEQVEMVTEITMTLRRAGPDETVAGRVAQKLVELEMSFSGELLGAEAPAGWKAESAARYYPAGVSVRWTRTGTAPTSAVEEGRAGFKVRLTGANAGVSCAHTIATDILGSGTVCGIPPAPPD